MFRTYQLIAVIGLPVLIGGCSDESSPPSAPQAEAAPRQAAPPSFAATATTQSRTQVRQLAASAFFQGFGPTGCVINVVSVTGAEETRKVSAGKPTTGPLAIVSLHQIDFCGGGETETVVHDILAQTNEGTFQAGPKLTEASLKATLTGTDFVTGAEVTVEVDVTWTGTGELRFESQNNLFRLGSLLLHFNFKGTFRDATATGTVSLAGENFTRGPALFADIERVRSGQMELIRAR
jgi:hypothetical protein